MKKLRNIKSKVLIIRKLLCVISSITLRIELLEKSVRFLRLYLNIIVNYYTFVSNSFTSTYNYYLKFYFNYYLQIIKRIKNDKNIVNKLLTMYYYIKI
jgi:tRNA G26 N,N-dimethylase Trm1